METAAKLQRHLFTVAEYHRMAEAGVFGEDDRIELLEGEIVEMPPMWRRCWDRPHLFPSPASPLWGEEKR